MQHVMRFGLAVEDFESPLCLRSSTTGRGAGQSIGAFPPYGTCVPSPAMPRRLKVAQLVPYYVPVIGGVEVVCQYISEALVARATRFMFSPRTEARGISSPEYASSRNDQRCARAPLEKLHKCRTLWGVSRIHLIAEA